MQIRLLHTEVPKIKFDKINPAASLPDRGELFDIGLEIFADKAREDVFAVIFRIDLTHHSDFRLQMDYLAWFEATGKVLPDFLESPFVQINAPAIAFPYLRSFVTLLTLNSGFTPAILPTVNFLKIAEGKKSA
jgi:preprotein translocase subunit SecB